MGETTVTPITPETEEWLESLLVSRLSAVCSIPVRGVLAPASTGEVAQLDDETFVEVKVEYQSQDGDYKYRSPSTYDATATVRVAMADDPNKSVFAFNRRAVNAIFNDLTGDDCSAFSSSTFECAEFVRNSTSSNFADAENPVYTKAYTATIKGRIIQPTNTTEA